MTPECHQTAVEGPLGASGARDRAAQRPGGLRAAQGRIALAVLATAFVAVGCADDSTPPWKQPVEPGDLSVTIIETPNGPMQCVAYLNYRAGGLDCVPLGWDPTAVTNTEDPTP